MTIWQRIVRFFRSLFTREDDMAALSERLDETYRQQNQLLQQVRRGYADVDTSRKRVELQLNQLRLQESQLADEAREAVARGDDDAARRALGQKLALEKAEAELVERHAALEAEQDRLRTSVMKIESDIDAFRVRKDTLNARRVAATARHEINSATKGIRAAGSEVGQAMTAAERRTRELEATADAVDELVAEGVVSHVGEDPREVELRRWEAEAAEIEQQLEQLHGKDA
ncbi:MAG TPA: PspA/IM30 family protein [Aeromicrobium sp.]|nr:PspA/IM30 family protein [Aeromicrobium sp.]